MKIMSLARKTLVILIALPIFGGFLGAVLSNLGFPSNPWDSLGAPSSPAEAFVCISPQLVVESVDGNMFTYTRPAHGWELYEGEIQSPTSLNEWSLCEDVRPPSIKEVIDSSEECIEWGLGYSYSKYVILSDGSVWKWNFQYSGEWEFIGFIFYILGGAIAFLVIALIILAFMHFNVLLKRLEERAQS